jgi:hypothetical protein
MNVDLAKPIDFVRNRFSRMAPVPALGQRDLRQLKIFSLNLLGFLVFKVCAEDPMQEYAYENTGARENTNASDMEQLDRLTFFLWAFLRSCRNPSRSAPMST